jgi:hypothetical protein
VVSVFPSSFRLRVMPSFSFVWTGMLQQWRLRLVPTKDAKKVRLEMEEVAAIQDWLFRSNTSKSCNSSSSDET